jgi:hypothetical protein
MLPDLQPLQLLLPQLQYHSQLSMLPGPQPALPMPKPLQPSPLLYLTMYSLDTRKNFLMRQLANADQPQEGPDEANTALDGLVGRSELNFGSPVEEQKPLAANLYALHKELRQVNKN